MSQNFLIEQFYNANHTELQKLALDKSELMYFTCPYDELNQDSIGFFHDPDTATTVLLLADGMGGHNEGEKASKAVVQSIINELKKNKEEGTISSIIQAIDNVHNKIQKNWNDAGTTLSIAEINDKSVRFYTIGDSPVLVLSQSGEVVYRSNLHSPKDFALKSGLFAEKTILQKEQDHLVSNVVGMDDYFVEVSPNLKLSKGDMVIVASDGLYDKNFNFEFTLIGQSDEELLESFLSHTNLKLPFDLSKLSDDTSLLFYRR